MIAVNPLHAAVSAHRAAYDAFQVAPEGEDSERASDAMCDALDALVVAATSLPILTRPLPAGAGALLDHLRWWLAEEAVHAEDYQPNYGILQGRAADLAAVLEPPPADEADPIVAAIVASDMAALVHAVTLVHRDEDDDESEALVDAALDARDVVFRAVQQTMPGTLSGLLTLVRFYGRDCRIYDGCGSGAGYFEHIAAALGLIIARMSPTWRLEPTARPAGPCVPAQPEIKAAWLALPSAERDRIGFIAVDMVFQAFVYGDGYADEDRALVGRSAVINAMRGAAEDASNARLSEIHRVIEAALPDLFGPDGSNPDWAVAMGAKR